MNKYICTFAKGNKYQFAKIVESIKDGVPCCFISNKDTEWFTVDDEIIEVGTIKVISKTLN